MKFHKNLLISQVTVGMEVVRTYAGRPVGLVGNPLRVLTVTKIGRTGVTLSDGTKMKLGEDEIHGIIAASAAK